MSYIYVCYPIEDRLDTSDGDIYASINMSEMESFTTMSKAVKFCKRFYSKYMIAVESADRGLVADIKKGEYKV